jgi:hypothetical protein
VVKSQVRFASLDQKYLIVSLLVIFFVWFIPYSIGKDTAIFVNDLYYVVVLLFLTMVSIYRLVESRKDSRKVWILFLVSIIAVLIAEHIWAIDELILDIKPTLSYANAAYLAYYLILIPFFIMYIKPLKKIISKKILVLSIAISCATIISSWHYLIQPYLGIYSIENISLSSYLIIDGVNLAPVSIGIILFFKGKTNFFPSLIFFAMISQLIADIIFQVAVTNGTYYSGSFEDLFFHMTFVLLLFGAYNFHRLDKNHDIGVKNA